MATDVAFQILRLLEYERHMIGVGFSPEQIRFFRRLNDLPNLVTAYVRSYLSLEVWRGLAGSAPLCVMDHILNHEFLSLFDDGDIRELRDDV